MFALSPLHYYAMARDYGWAPQDEDSPEQFCTQEGFTDQEILDIADVEFWRDEFKVTYPEYAK